MTASAAVMVKVLYEAKDRASKAIKNTTRALHKNRTAVEAVETAAGRMRGAFESMASGDVLGGLRGLNSNLGTLGGSLKGVGGLALRGSAGVVAVGVAAAGASQRFTEWSVSIEQTRERLDQVFGRGKGAASALAIAESLEGVTIPAVLDLTQAIRTTGVSAQFTEKQLKNLINRAAGQGQSGDVALRKFSQALRDASGEQLKDIGIYIKLEEAMADYKKQIGMTTGVVTKKMEQEALARALVVLLSKDTETLTGRFQAQDKALASLKNTLFSLKMELSRAFSGEALEGVKALGVALKAVVGFSDSIAIAFRLVAKSSFIVTTGIYDMTKAVVGLGSALSKLRPTFNPLAPGLASKFGLSGMGAVKSAATTAIKSPYAGVMSIAKDISKLVGSMTGGGAKKAGSVGAKQALKASRGVSGWVYPGSNQLLDAFSANANMTKKQIRKTAAKKVDPTKLFGGRPLKFSDYSVSREGLDEASMSPAVAAAQATQKLEIALRMNRARISLVKQGNTEARTGLETEQARLELHRKLLDNALKYGAAQKNHYDLDAANRVAQLEHETTLKQIAERKAEGAWREKEARLGIAGAVGRSIAEQIKHEKARAAILSIVAAAEAYRNLAQPIPNVAGFIAAMSASTLYARAAFGGGGGGAKTAGGSGGGGAIGQAYEGGGVSGSGGGTQVTNYNGLFMTKQQLAKKMASTQATAKNTGI